MMVLGTLETFKISKTMPTNKKTMALETSEISNNRLKANHKLSLKMTGSAISVHLRNQRISSIKLQTSKEMTLGYLKVQR